MENTYSICGLIYNNSPKSRIEKLLIDIINGGGGGGGYSSLDIGNGLTVHNGTLSLNTTNNSTTDGSDSTLPMSSGGLQAQFDKAEMILGRV